MNLATIRIAPLLVLGALLGACTESAVGSFATLDPAVDAGRADQESLTDMRAPPQDFTGVAHDMAVAPRDLTAPLPDLTGADLSGVVVDMTATPDLVAASDLVPTPDLVPVPDLVSTPDLEQPDGGAGGDFCFGRVSDKKVYALGALARPAVGVWVKDPDFGTLITRVTDAGANNQISPVYSTVPAWNADGTLMLLYHWGDGHYIYDAKTYKKIGPLDCTTKLGWNPGPSDVEHVMWDPSDPQMILFPSRYAPGGGGSRPNLYRCNVNTHVAEIVHDFNTAPSSCPFGTDLLMGSDPQWYPGNMVGLLCGTKKWIYDMKNDKVYTPRSGAGFADDLAAVAAPSGTVAFYNGFVYDNDLNQLRKLDMAVVDEHANIGRNKKGDDYYYAVDYDGKDPGVIQAHNLQTGTRTPLVAQSLGWGYPPTGVHITSVSADPRAHGWVMASVVNQPPKIELFTMELVLANIDTKAVCRVGRHRSYGGDGPNGYQAEPHPVFHILGDGTMEALFASDWGGTNQVDAYLIRIPPG